MLFDLVDILHKKRRLLFLVAFISIDIWLLTFCSQTLQTHRTGITNRIRNSESSLSQVSAEGDIFAGGAMSDGIGRLAKNVEIGVLRTTVRAADGVSSVQRGLQTAATSSFHLAQTATMAAIHGVGSAAGSTLRFAGMVIGTSARLAGHSVLFTAKTSMFPSIVVGRSVAYAYGTTSGAVNTNLAAIIQPRSNINIPIITPEQAQQVSLIQKDTLAVTPTKPTGAGGACDNGAGNGGYPMEWCDARMDTIRTVAYSADRINRQCTSYAYWYFTAIEGHTDFHVTGNANRWAQTSNYPTHGTPAVGAIAVQTSGYYGHVAIVQALPGQTYEGNVVPDGYVLVSEMNYDWQGHFRYSYSPLSKFSAYIYP